MDSETGHQRAFANKFKEINSKNLAKKRQKFLLIQIEGRTSSAWR